MKKSGRINTNILLRDDSEAERCKDTKGYIRETLPKLILMGCIFIFFGMADVYTTFAGGQYEILYFAFYLFFIVFMWFGYALDKLHKKYF